MSEPASSYRGAWSNFYVMTGSSAAALTGLMFVVITLLNAEERRTTTADGTATYSTPTVMNFAAALLLSAIMVAPWRLLLHAAIFASLIGFGGLTYLVRVTLLARRLTAYTPDTEDLIWYLILPFVAYAAITVGAVALPSIPIHALFPIGAGLLLLLFIGIRNAWDVVTYLAIKRTSSE